MGALAFILSFFKGNKSALRTRRSEKPIGASPPALRSLSLSENRTPHRTNSSGLGAVIFLRRDSAPPESAALSPLQRAPSLARSRRSLSLSRLELLNLASWS